MHWEGDVDVAIGEFEHREGRLVEMVDAAEDQLVVEHILDDAPARPDQANVVLSEPGEVAVDLPDQTRSMS